jgi:addiction module RelE/StbE family toxin
MRVVWAKSAIEDLKAIRAYIARDSAYYAARFAQRIANAIKALRSFPELGQVIPKFGRYVVRERIVQNYRVLYTVEKDSVVILAVVHAARDMDSITLPERT